MRKNALIISCITCVFGAFGAFFRWLLDLTAFEAESGLYIPGNIWSKALVITCLGCAAALLAAVMKLKKKDGLALSEDYSAAMCGSTVAFKPIYIFISALMAAGGVLLALSAGENRYSVFQLILAVLGILAAVGFWLMMSAAKRRRDPPLNCFGATLIILLYCFWLIVSYRENTASPVIWSYAMELLAISGALAASYFIAGVPFGRQKPFVTIFFCQFAAFLCITTLPDKRATGQQIMLIATAVMLVFVSWILISNLRVPQAEPEPQEQDTPEDNAEPEDE